MESTVQAVLIECGVDSKAVDDSVLDYIASVCGSLVEMNEQSVEEWEAGVGSVLAGYIDETKANECCRRLMDRLYKKAAAAAPAKPVIPHFEGRVVAVKPLTMGFMGRILIEQSELNLERSRCYGLVGKNGVGKTTLMRMMAAHTLTGFPRGLRVTYVEHEISVAEGVTATKYLASSPHNTDKKMSEPQAEQHLYTFGFSASLAQTPVLNLSGGYKMRLALSVAALSNPDILLLDEPTNHLDTSAVDWLVKFVKSLKNVIVVVVSHDPPFLDSIVTDVLMIHNQQLTTYTNCNFTQFLERSEKDAQANLQDLAPLVFPSPGTLIGVHSRSKTILKLADASFEYVAGKRILENVTVRLTLGSRIGIIGPNGAGKSTLVKMIVGEVHPKTGKLWKHHNLRVSYVAQHHIHHLEAHLNRSPIEYVQQRFRKGHDEEILQMSTLKLTKTEEKDLKQRGRPEEIVGRRKHNNKMEYEVKWFNLDNEYNSWVSIDRLHELAAHKLALQYDEMLLAHRAGVDTRPLHSAEVIHHLDRFGLREPNARGEISMLSAGQRARLTLACAMWIKPHVIILDEPTNYLDTHALGLLKEAITHFEGCVVMVSHHQHFISELCSETWQVGAGRVNVIEAKQADDDSQN